MPASMIWVGAALENFSAQKWKKFWFHVHKKKEAKKHHEEQFVPPPKSAISTFDNGDHYPPVDFILHC